MVASCGVVRGIGPWKVMPGALPGTVCGGLRSGSSRVVIEVGSRGAQRSSLGRVEPQVFTGYPRGGLEHGGILGRALRGDGLLESWALYCLKPRAWVMSPREWGRRGDSRTKGQVGGLRSGV